MLADQVFARRYVPFFQSRGQDNNLRCGSRRISVVDSTLQIPGSQYVTGCRIDGDHRAASALGERSEI
jgi:hypothetical protein